jgi:SAM-dependent methyltransferase
VTRRESTYDRLASEYYDSTAHPTCANFRDGSKILAAQWLATHWDHGNGCDIGAGRSLFYEIAVDLGLPTAAIAIVDSSPDMLRHTTVSWPGTSAQCIVAEAHALPFADSSMTTVLASLGDPYNDADFWLEVARILTPDGCCLFTTPSYAWASAFRSTVGDEPDTAVFILRDGTTIPTPSFVRDDRSQRLLVERAGLSIVRTCSVAAHELPPPLSRKIEAVADATAEVVTGYDIRLAGVPMR